MTQFVEQNAPPNDNPPVMEYPLYLAPLVLYSAWSLAKSRAQVWTRTAPVRRAPGAQPDGGRIGRPRIDPARCIGCGACIVACPEQRRRIVLGLVAGQAALLSPQHCRGHGDCREACPTGAITLDLFEAALKSPDHRPEPGSPWNI